ncbi:hypothetical protein ACJZ2D_002672 [Fusarium nematophilum]
MSQRLSVDATSFAASRTIRSSSSHQDPPPSQEEEIRRKPWKYIGYKGYASFLSSDGDFFVLRRFKTLNVRVALALQDEMSVLEEQLSELDAKYSSIQSEDLNNGTFRGDLEGRRVLVELIAEKLRRYNDFVLQQTNLRRYPEAPHRDARSNKNWHHNHGGKAIAEEEQKYLNHDDDLISVVERDKTPLRCLIDTSRTLRTLPIWKHKSDETPDYDAENVSYYSDKRMYGFACAVIITVGVIMLISPIWVLQAMSSLQAKLGVITAFVFTFLLVL